jgi:hypothetical protein
MAPLMSPVVVDLTSLEIIANPPVQTPTYSYVVQNSRRSNERTKDDILLF